MLLGATAATILTTPNALTHSGHKLTKVNKMTATKATKANKTATTMPQGTAIAPVTTQGGAVVPAAYIPSAPVVNAPIPDPVQAGKQHALHLVAVTQGNHPSVSAPTVVAPREGTARSVAYKLLKELAGKPLPVVLGALKVAETQWHLNTTRTVKSIQPAGWLRTLGCKVS